ncbi:hypothetical protein C8R46DRAFT_1235070 [Mycena filopes]|nr:hypothetical protein C8R46DRAFT_1235070 [Mycena filopes]
MPICNLTCLNLTRFPCAEEENFLPKIDSSTLTIAPPPASTSAPRASVPRANTLAPQLSGTFGIPLRVYPCLKINFISPALVAALRAFAKSNSTLIPQLRIPVLAIMLPLE